MLLAGLEDEVLRSGQIGGCVSDEDVAAEGVKAMRCAIESLVNARAGGAASRRESGA